MLHFRSNFLAIALLLACGLVQAQSTHDACFLQAGNKYNLDHLLLKAIGITESSLRTNAINVNTNKSEDYGIMQINSTWLPQLKTWGITKETLLTDACTNIHVGAWVLAQNVQQLGTTWNAVGAYNAGAHESRKSLRQGYVQKVWRNHARLVVLEAKQEGQQEAQNIVPSAPPVIRLRTI